MSWEQLGQPLAVCSNSCSYLIFLLICQTILCSLLLPSLFCLIQSLITLYLLRFWQMLLHYDLSLKDLYQLESISHFYWILEVNQNEESNSIELLIKSPNQLISRLLILLHLYTLCRTSLCSAWITLES